MNPSSLDACERAKTIDCAKAQENLSFSQDDEVSQRRPLWIPEDIAEPEPWTLVSFSDFLPYENDSPSCSTLAAAHGPFGLVGASRRR